MNWFNRLVERLRDEDNEERFVSDDPVDEDEDDYTEPPSPLASLMERVMRYRDDEFRDMRDRAYDAESKLGKLERDLGLMTYERNEALQRIAKIFLLLNQKQKAELAKPPITLKYGTPPLQMHVFDENMVDYRRVDVPPPAKMDTYRRKGSQEPAVLVFRADNKTKKRK
jgi:hypothetical protein